MQEEKKNYSYWPIVFSRGGVALVNALLPIFLVRMLTPEEIGIYKIFFLYLEVLPVFAFSNGIVNGLAFWAGKRKEGDHCLETAGQLLLIHLTLFSVLTLALNPVFARMLEIPENIAFLLSLSFLGIAAGKFFTETAVFLGKVWLGSIAFGIFELLRIFSMLFMAWYYQSVEAVLTANLIAFTLIVVAGYCLAWKADFFSLKVSKRAVKEVYRYAVPVSFAAICAVLAGKADQLMLARYISASEFAFYSIGCLLLPPLFIYEESISKVLIPQLSGLFSKEQHAEAAGLYKKAASQIAILIIPAVAGLMVFAEPIVELLFTAEYIKAAGYLRIFSLAYLALIIPFDSTARARGAARWLLKMNVMACILSVTAVCIFTSLYGAYGALAAMLIVRILIRLYGMFYIRSTEKWAWESFIPLDKFAVYAMASLLLSVCCLMLKPLFGLDLVWFIVCGGAFGLLYFPFVFGIFSFRVRCLDKEPLRVLHLVQFLPVGGLEKMVLDLTSNLKEKGHVPYVYAYDHEGYAEEVSFVSEFRKAGIETCIRAKKTGFSVKTIFQIADYLLENRIFLIHTHNLGPLMYSGFVRILLGGSVKLIHTQHSFVHLQECKKYSLYERIFSRLANQIVLVGEALKENYRELGVPERKLTVIDNGIEFAAALTGEKETRSELLKGCQKTDWRNFLEKHMEDFWIIYLSRIHPVKGQKEAVEIWKLLPEAVKKQCVLIFAGPESEPDQIAPLKEKLKADPCGGKVVFTGAVKNVTQWMQASDMFLSCSQYEGMPLAPIEALGAGVPVMLSDIPGHRFLNDRAVIYPENDFQAGSQALEKFIHKIKTGNLNQICRENAQYVRNTYSISRMADNYIRLYQRYHYAG